MGDLNLRAVKAAKLVSLGFKDAEVIRQSGVGKTSFYSLKKSADFKETVQWFIFERGLADPVSVAQSSDRETQIIGKLDELAHSLADAALKMSGQLNEAEELDMKLLPGIVTSIKAVLDTKRVGEDRISGIEGLLNDLESVEAQIKAKVVSIDRTQPHKAA